MSDYCRMKVLRVPINKYIPDSEFDYDEFEAKHKYVMGYTPGYFEVMTTNTGNYYLDFILERNDGEYEGWWGKTRHLFKNECIKYYDVFRMIFPNVKMRDVHLVEYCWYTATEPEDYYSLKEDEFWKESPSVSELMSTKVELK